MCSKTLFDKSVAREQVLFSDASFNPSDYPDDAQPTTGTRQEFSEVYGHYCDPEERQSIRENHGIGLDDDGEETEEEGLDEITDADSGTEESEYLGEEVEQTGNRVEVVADDKYNNHGEHRPDAHDSDKVHCFTELRRHRVVGIARRVVSSAQLERKHQKKVLRKFART